MNTADERADLVRDRAEEWKLDRRVVEEAFPLRWKTNGIAAQVVFFILTSLGLGALYLFCEAIDLKGGAVTCVVAIGLAEYLIRERRWFRTGVESALWLGGLIAAITLLPSSGKPEALLVFALAAAIAGARVRNPLFGAAAAILVIVYCEERFDLGVVSALVVAGAALVALQRTWRRPTNEWLFVAIAVTAPVAGWPLADEKWRPMTIALYAAFGVAALVLALRRRHHAMFISAAVGIAIAGTELARTIAVRLELKLAVAGAALLAVSWIVARVLRDRTHGLVVTAARLTRADEVLQIAGAITFAPRESESAPSGPEGGGSFGGAGATGDL